MAQLFRPGANTLTRLLLAAVVAVPALLLVLGITVGQSGAATGQDRFVDQPVPFSHLHHAGDLRIDCRVCHTGVESGAHPGVPPTQPCMGSHTNM